MAHEKLKLRLRGQPPPLIILALYIKRLKSESYGSLNVRAYPWESSAVAVSG
jgi:hypothetical protein